jgi:hypothetical protein
MKEKMLLLCWAVIVRVLRAPDLSVHSAPQMVVLEAGPGEILVLSALE